MQNRISHSQTSHILPLTPASPLPYLQSNGLRWEGGEGAKVCYKNHPDHLNRFRHQVADSVTLNKSTASSILVEDVSSIQAEARSA